ncbi:hypothetical protein PVAG01_07684 [Phlyctema vagabunda]|uniref:Uncharacterized protein n=1 Tax=Phlyctema vagabunda TaxID=108571 RepID=A0ABR4PD51_9HELO
MLLRERIEALEAELNKDVEVEIKKVDSGNGSLSGSHSGSEEVLGRHSTDDKNFSRPLFSNFAKPARALSLQRSHGRASERRRAAAKQELAPSPLTTTTTNSSTSTTSPPIIASNNPYAQVNYEKHQISVLNDESPSLEEQQQMQQEDEADKLSTLPTSSIAETLGLSHLRAEDSIEYNVYNAFVTNLRVCPVDLQGAYYYVEHRSFVPNTPGAILREGYDKAGRSIGVANLPYIGINTLGLGDFENAPHDMQWERMAKGAFWSHTKYEFEFGPVGARRKFWWIRTNMMVLDDQGDLVLVEEGNESEVLAEYTGKGILKWKKRGALRIRNAEATFGEGWLRMVVLSWAAIVELARRRARQRRLSALHLL